jgi:hypothetical protein
MASLVGWSSYPFSHPRSSSGEDVHVSILKDRHEASLVWPVRTACPLTDLALRACRSYDGIAFRPHRRNCNRTRRAEREN